MNAAARQLLILGSGKFAVDVADFATEAGDWQVSAFVQNMEPSAETEFEGFKVLWIDDALSRFPGALAVCALGSQKRHKIIEQAAAGGASFATLIHPFTRVSPRSDIGEGAVVSPGAVIAGKSRIGPHVFINRAASIGHHTRVDDYSFIGPGATVCGSCVIGPGSFIGAGAVISDHIEIGAGSFVCAGAVVTRNVAARTRVMGVPARPGK